LTESISFTFLLLSRVLSHWQGFDKMLCTLKFVAVSCREVMLIVGECVTCEYSCIACSVPEWIGNFGYMGSKRNSTLYSTILAGWCCRWPGRCRVHC